jgi:hypothetical protein
LNLGAKLLKGAGTSVASSVGGDIAGNLVETLMEQEDARQTIKQLRDNLEEMIAECLMKDREKGILRKGFLVFVDDLDRIDPPLAVQILELLKNIFDIHHCIFVLAIDYDVVIKGLKPKFGELTDKNEREFRSFFDKIIQMPFSMPVASYTIDDFLIQNLVKLGYIKQDNAGKAEVREGLSQICNLSVGTNPRSLKRLMNTVSLITIISAETEDDGDGDVAQDAEDVSELVLNFALICIQVAFPVLYKVLCMESNFPEWSDTIARSLKLRELTPDEQQKLAQSELFNDDWEQILYRICERDTYLSGRVVQISQLFNLMLKFIPENKNTGELIGELLALSSVTDIQAFDKPKQAVHEGNVLRALSSQLLPLLKSQLNKRWPLVHQQGKRVVSQLHISFDKKDWVAFISCKVDERKGQLMLLLWQHPWIFKDSLKNEDIWKRADQLGVKSELQALKSEYDELPGKHPGFIARYESFTSVGYSKNHMVPHLTYEYPIQQVQDLQQLDHLEKIAAFIWDNMECYRKLAELNKRN